jgi:hypothetical protein
MKGWKGETMDACMFRNNIRPQKRPHSQQMTEVRDNDLVGWLYDTTQYQITRTTEED